MRKSFTNLWIIALLAVLFVPSVSRADTAPTLWKQVGTSGIGPGQFIFPDGLAFDPILGRMYVKDLYGHVNVYNGVGTWVTWWGSDPGLLGNDAGIFVDNSNFVYVVDSDHHQILKFTSDGHLVLAWGSQGSGPGQFTFPIYGAFNPVNHLVYVSDQMNHRVQEFTTNGEYRGTVGPVGTGPEPYAIGIDSQTGDVIVTYFNAANVTEIRKFTSAGVPVAQWGAYGSGNGQFKQPFCVAVDSQHQAWITDRYNNRVQVFDSNGAYLFQFTDQSFNLPTAIAFDDQGHIWISIHYGDVVDIFIDPSGPTATRSISWGELKTRYR